MRLAALAVVLLSTLALPARADVLSAINRTRSGACAASQVAAGSQLTGASRVAAASRMAALGVSPLLTSAALHMARGQSLHDSLIAVGYLSTRSTAIRLSGTVADDEVERMLGARYCAQLRDPQLTQVGAQRLGRDVWIVLAAPIALPTSADAGRVTQRILELVNEARASGRRCGNKSFAAAAPLKLNTALIAAARIHSQAMATYGEFDHRGHDGSTPAVRIERAGYGEHRLVGENIAAGAMTATEVAQGWLSSPAHCENIMDPRFTDTGIAFAVNSATSELVYWTQDFALADTASHKAR